MENQYLWYALGAGVLALAYGVFLILKILKQPQGEGKMIEIAKAIQAGAKAYLNRQYKSVGIVALIIIALMWLANFSGNTIAGFILGALLSAAAGFVGMNISVRANVRTAEAAAQKLHEAQGESKKIVGDAAREAEGLVATARTHAVQQGSGIVKGAEERASGILKDAAAHAEEAKRQVLKESEREIARAAMLAAEKLLLEKSA